MPSERLELIIEAMNYANAELDELKRDLEGVGTAGKKGDSGVGQLKMGLNQLALVGGSVMAAGYAVKKAWDFTKEGAQLELTAEQYENVTTNVGYASEALMQKLRAATDGMVTDAELTASALQIIELGLVGTEEGVVELADAIATLGLDTQQVIMTFANNSELRLDSLGLSLERVRTRAKELEAQGFVGDAFDQAVLEGLTDRMRVLGDTSETTAGQIAMLEADLANLKDDASEAAVAIGGPLIGKVAAARKAVKFLSFMYAEGSVTIDEYIQTQIALRHPLADTTEILGDLYRKQRDVEAITQKSASTYYLFMRRGLELAEAQGKITAADQSLYESMILAGEGSQFMLERLGLLAEQEWLVAREAEDADRALLNLANRTVEVGATTTTVLHESYRAYGHAASAEEWYGRQAAEVARQSNVAGKHIRDTNAAVSESRPTWEAFNQELSIAGQRYSTLSASALGAKDAMQEQLDFLAVGGGILAGLRDSFNQALDAGDFDLAQKIADEYAIAATDADLELGNIDTTEAAARLVEELGITPEEAEAIVADLESTLLAVTSQTYVLKFKIDVEGQLPGVPRRTQGATGGTKDQEDEFATGTGGWVTVPGAPDEPRSITVHGGERMNVMNQSQWSDAQGGGAPVIVTQEFYGDFNIATADEGLKLLARIVENGRRQALSQRAGSGYTG